MSDAAPGRLPHQAPSWAAEADSEPHAASGVARRIEQLRAQVLRLGEAHDALESRLIGVMLPDPPNLPMDGTNEVAAMRPAQPSPLAAELDHLLAQLQGATGRVIVLTAQLDV